MTATATIYTAEGFAIAADGRRSWGYEPSSLSRKFESDEVQKIFEVSGPETSLAYSVKGSTVNERGTWDISLEVQNSLKAIDLVRARSPLEYFRHVMFDLQNRIQGQIQCGELEGFPKSELCFVGYFRSVPIWIDACSTPYYDHRGLRFQVIAQELFPLRNLVSGSQILVDMIKTDDARLDGSFSGLFHPDMTLHDAAMLARRYIETCCSPLIRQLEPDGCKTIGGHIHVATITKPTRTKWLSRLFRKSSDTAGGFRWVTPPLGVISSTAL